jgi:hypothetical protein
MMGSDIILQQATFEKWVKAHYEVATLGTFMTCIKNIFMHNILYLIWVSLLVFGLDILIFKKLMISNITWKKSLKLKFKE